MIFYVWFLTCLGDTNVVITPDIIRSTLHVPVPTLCIKLQSLNCHQPTKSSYLCASVNAKSKCFSVICLITETQVSVQLGSGDDAWKSWCVCGDNWYTCAGSDVTRRWHLLTDMRDKSHSYVGVVSLAAVCPKVTTMCLCCGQLLLALLPLLSWSVAGSVGKWNVSVNQLILFNQIVIQYIRLQTVCR